MEKVFKFYINSSIHVALAVVSFVCYTLMLMQADLNAPLLIFMFCGTVTGYNFVKYAKVAGLHHRSLTESLKAIQIFSAFCFLGALASLLFLQLDTLLVLLLFFALTFFYAVPLGHKNLRTFSGLKILIVGLVWAGVTVIVPFFEIGLPLYGDAWLLFVQRFLLVVVLTMPFEIRDLQYDEEKLKTLPQVLGVEKTKLLGIASLVLVMIIEGFKDELQWYQVVALFVCCALTGWALLKSQKKQSGYFASFWVESIPIASFILLSLFAHFL